MEDRPAHDRLAAAAAKVADAACHVIESHDISISIALPADAALHLAAWLRKEQVTTAGYPALSDPSAAALAFADAILGPG